MPGIRKGFTFLELIIVVLLVGMIASIVIPALQHRVPGYKRKEFITQLGALVNLAWQNALIEQRMHRVWFDVEKNIARVEIQKISAPGDTKERFEPINVPYIKSEYHWPSTIHIKQLLIDGVDITNQPD